MKISIIIPFYKGNQHLERLFNSIKKVADHTKVAFEILVVNDSPSEHVILPDVELDVVVITNEHNLGIHGARVNGIEHADGDWILMLDQDDELVVDGFKKQIELTKNADVVVGNGTYVLGKVNKRIFDNQKCMDYLIQKNRFTEIRNLIPSPGECLIRKEIIPQVWLDNRLIKNGSDDWMLWLLLFSYNVRFVCNELPVYIHNDAGGANLSSNLDKMRESSLEMAQILYRERVLTDSDLKKLSNAINFKFLQDTKQLTVDSLWKYRGTLISNIKYRAKLNYLKYR